MESDKVADLNEPVMNLDLQLDSSKSKLVTLELKKDDLKNLITSLEAANKVGY